MLKKKEIFLLVLSYERKAYYQNVLRYYQIVGGDTQNQQKATSTQEKTEIFNKFCHHHWNKFS